MPQPDRPTRELVAAIRAERGLTQEGLARQLGVAFSTVNAWEAGRSEPQMRHRRRLESMVGGGQAAAATDGRLQVLCVDDSPLDLELLVALVNDAAAALGLDLVVVGESDATRALLSLGRLQPDIAFVDVVMPGFDGFELADRVQQMTELSVGRLVLVTAQRDADIDTRAAERDLLVLDKPVTIRDVGAALRSVDPAVR